MKRVGLVLVVFLLIGSGALAMQPEVIGGIRDGLAGGLMAEAAVAKNVGIRFGLEADTGKQPLIIFFGGKFLLTYVERSPLSVGVGLVAYSGSSKTDVGLALSFIFNRAFNIEPLFFEFGVDVADKGRLQAQVGYKIY